MDYKHGYLFADIICPEKRTMFREHSSRKIVSFKAQIMSEDKYPSIFALQIEAILFIIAQVFFALRAFLKFGELANITHLFPRLSWGNI